MSSYAIHQRTLRARREAREKAQAVLGLLTMAEQMGWDDPVPPRPKPPLNVDLSP